MVRFSILALVAVAADLARAHTVITYPGWRGNNLITNGSLPQSNPESIGVDYSSNGTVSFPFGMQTVFPCGGLPMSQNRSYWPVKGGALTIEPGWGTGHKEALIYINMGVTEPGQEAPSNYSYTLVPPFAISGPNNSGYGGEFCLPQVPMPVGLNLQVGDLVTVQVVELSQNGAAFYSCVDLNLTDPTTEPDLVEEVNAYNCYNSTDIKFSLLFTTASLTSDGFLRSTAPTLFWTLMFAIGAGMYSWL